MSELNILMIDDDVVDVLDVERALRRRGISNPLRVARDGVEALDMLLGRNGSEPVPAPRIILLDLNMPRMDGFEFLRELRAQPLLEDDLVFVLTTSDDDRHRAWAHELGVAGYIVKDELPLRALDLVLQGLQSIPPAVLGSIEVTDLVRHVAASLDPGGRFDLVLPSAVLLLETAADRLELVFRHLIDNAMEHHDKERGRIKVWWEEIGGLVHFRVTDDGPGIPRHQQRDVLRPLHTSKIAHGQDPAAGQGMGLAIVNHIVAAAGGTLAIHGSEGRGSTVSFTWPLTWTEVAEVPLVSMSPLEASVAEAPALHEIAARPVDVAGPGRRPARRAAAADAEGRAGRGLPYDVVLVVRDELDRVGIRRAMIRRGFGGSLHVADDADAALDLLRVLQADAPAGAVRLVVDHELLAGRGGDLLGLVRADAGLGAVPAVLLVSPEQDADAVAGQVDGIAGVVARQPPAYTALLELLDAWGRAPST